MVGFACVCGSGTAKKCAVLYSKEAITLSKSAAAQTLGQSAFESTFVTIN